jgi:dienelactone hydrolase
MGATALALGWFGGPGQPPSIREVPLELFSEALDVLESLGVGRLAIVGLSKGAEAALLVACRDPRVSAVVAIAPTSVAWAEIASPTTAVTFPFRSSWTVSGQPVPFVPYDDAWRPPDAAGRPAFRDLYLASMARFPETVRAAAIPVERCAADLVLIAGGDDQVWPSDEFAEQLAARRLAAGLSVEVFLSTAAGHRIPFPGEPAPGGGADLNRGGDPAADAALGLAAWPAVLRALRLDS